MISVLIVGFAGKGRAQTQISPDEFLDQATGKTLTFSDYMSGNQVGVEQFLRRDRSIWATRDGRCTHGLIRQEGPYLCFIYEDFSDPDNCWLPFLSEGELLVMSTGQRQVQRVTEISDAPVICSDKPMS